VFSI